MTYAITMDVPQPAEMYEKVHAIVTQRLGREMPEGCLLHLATRTDGGFSVTEVWETHEAADRFGDDVLRPVILEVSGLSPAEMLAQGPPPSRELDVLGLTVDARARVGV
ncbi:MAG: hypothetical protein QOJ32_1556 [Frankiaceae bacterium]|jgi:hypothetical protein|nr:hypothetical protein [Frankiaceae bacterium]MDQ1648074.1 hypothetical protein [Frankiaceae bacterium]